MCKLGGFNLKKFTFVILLITLVMFIGLNYFNRPSIENNVYSPEDKRDTYLNIMTCNIAQYKMVKLIVGDKHNVAYMFNNESDMQKYQVSVDAVNNVSNMDLFFYSGQEYEPWGNSLIEKLDKVNKQIDSFDTNFTVLSYDDLVTAWIKFNIDIRITSNERLQEYESYKEELAKIERIKQELKRKQDDAKAINIITLSFI